MQANSSTSNSKFKSILFFSIKVLVFLAVILPSTTYVGKKYAAASTENVINDYNKKRFADFYSLPPNSLDLVFLGSSHSYCTFDPALFDEALGISSFQMGMPLQHPDSTYFTLLEVLNYQKPKVAVVEVYWDMLDDAFEMKQASMLFQVLRNKALEQQYIKEVFPLGEKLKYNRDITKYQLDYFAYKNNDLQKRMEAALHVKAPETTEKQVGTEKYATKGFLYCDYKMLPDEFDKTNQFKRFDGKKWKFDKKQKHYLQEIVDTCAQNNIKLVFVTAPVANVSLSKMKNYYYVNEQVSDFAEENSIPYIDYNVVSLHENILTNDNFRDDAHLNNSGVKIVDAHFINWLKENEEITNALR